jgi:hypothetical protein
MTNSHLHRLVRLVGFATAATWVGAGCTSYPSAPSDPAYDTDVLPIFEAHCNRCHGNGPDGGSLNVAAGTQDTAMGPPLACFTQYGLNPDAGVGSCTAGANSQAPAIGSYVHSTMVGMQMPPPPAAQLNSYELGVIDAWVAESPRKCSNSPNPDPALHCPSGSYP